MSSLVGKTPATYTNASEVYKRVNFYASGLHWVFYSSGSSILYRTSSNGTSWGPQIVFTGSFSNDIFTFSLCYEQKNNYLHYAVQSSYGANVPIMYQRGTPNSNGTFSWSASQQTAVLGLATGFYGRNTIAVDSNGYPWIGYYTYIPSPVSIYPLISKSSANNGTWSTQAGFPRTGSLATTQNDWAVVIVPLETTVGGNSQVVMIYGYQPPGGGTGSLYADFWTGSAWSGSGETIVSNLEGASSRLDFQAGSIGDIIYLAYLTVGGTTSSIYYCQKTYPNGVWSSGSIVDLLPRTSAPTISVNKASSNRYIFWNSGSKFFYSKNNTTPTLWLSESIKANDQIFSSNEVTGSIIGVSWLSGSASPYDYRYYFLIDGEMEGSKDFHFKNIPRFEYFSD